MTGRGPMAASLALHALVVAAALWDPTGEATPPPDRPELRAVVFVPRMGRAKTEAMRRTGSGAGDAPGWLKRLEGVEITVDDRQSADLVAVLRRWGGAVTRCGAEPAGGLRVWLYDPDQWEETRGRADIPCADFPAPFRVELARQVGLKAGARGVAAVTIGFRREAEGGVVVVRISG